MTSDQVKVSIGVVVISGVVGLIAGVLQYTAVADPVTVQQTSATGLAESKSDLGLNTRATSTTGRSASESEQSDFSEFESDRRIQDVDLLTRFPETEQ